MPDEPFPATRPALEIVSSCPRCGAPIYGRGFVIPGDDPQLQFSCECRKPTDSLLPVRTT